MNSEVLVNTGTFVAVLVGFYHKYRGGQAYRYYIEKPDGTVKRVMWASLDNEKRQMVIKARKPYWAKDPGSLK